MRFLAAALCFALALAIPIGLHFEVIPWPPATAFRDDVLVREVHGVRIEISRRLREYWGDPRPENWPADLRGSIAVRLTHAEAGTITLSFGAPQTITTTAAQDARLEKLRAHSQARGLPYATIEAMLRAFLLDHLQQKVEEARGVEGGDFCAAFKAKTPAERAATIAAHGGNEPACP
jgi:hypothetical protein